MTGWEARQFFQPPHRQRALNRSGSRWAVLRSALLIMVMVGLIIFACHLGSIDSLGFRLGGIGTRSSTIRTASAVVISVRDSIQPPRLFCLISSGAVY